MFGAQRGASAEPTHVVRIGRFCHPPKRISLIEEALPGCLGDQEQLIVCLPDTDSFTFRRVHRDSVGWLMSIAIAVTSQRVLFFGSPRPLGVTRGTRRPIIPWYPAGSQALRPASKVAHYCETSSAPTLTANPRSPE